MAFDTVHAPCGAEIGHECESLENTGLDAAVSGAANVLSANAAAPADAGVALMDVVVVPFKVEKWELGSGSKPAGFVEGTAPVVVVVGCRVWG